MAKYRCCDWYGNIVKTNICNLKEAVREALKHKYEVRDENGDIIFSQWDGWNGDYPNIKYICFPIADVKMVNKAKQFLINTGMYHEWCKLESDNFYRWVGKEWLHSDRWSTAYDWVNDGKFSDVDIPEDIIECLVEYWETNALHIKIGV